MHVLITKSLYALFLGAGFMLAMSLTVYRKSYYFKRAEAKMHGEEEKPRIRSRLVTLMVLFAMILFFAVVDLWISVGDSLSFVYLSVFNLLLAALLSLFDALFVDYFLLVAWRPALLGLPECQPTRTMML